MGCLYFVAQISSPSEIQFAFGVMSKALCLTQHCQDLLLLCFLLLLAGEKNLIEFYKTCICPMYMGEIQND